MEIRKIKIEPRLVIALLLIALGIAMRLLPHEPNFAPVGAIALFGGAILGWQTAVWLPLAIMMGADMLIGFYPGMLFTWTGFVIVSLFGTLLRRCGLLTRISLGAIGSGIIFYVISNFGVWMTSGMYPATIPGLLDCYYMALPFLRTSLLADLFYSAILFGVYALAMKFAAKRRGVALSELSSL